MTAVCPREGCGYSEQSDSRRGGTLGTCPKDGTQLRAWTAGRSKGRFMCPVIGRPVTLGLRYTVQLAEPMRLVFRPGWDTVDKEPDPARPGWLRDVKGQRTEPDDRERELLANAAGHIFGPGCVLSSDFEPGYEPWKDRAGLRLEPVPDADPATWFVNEPLKYKKCAACGHRTPVTGDSLMTEPWSPKRDTSWAGGHGRRSHLEDTNPGPHPAGTVACQRCREGEPEPF